MPFYTKGDVRIHYEEVGSGFPLLVTPGGGLNSLISNCPNQVFNAMEEFKNDFRCMPVYPGLPKAVVWVQHHRRRALDVEKHSIRWVHRQHEGLVLGQVGIQPGRQSGCLQLINLSRFQEVVAAGPAETRDTSRL